MTEFDAIKIVETIESNPLDGKTWTYVYDFCRVVMRSFNSEGAVPDIVEVRRLGCAEARIKFNFASHISGHAGIKRTDAKPADVAAFFLEKMTKRRGR